MWVKHFFCKKTSAASHEEVYLLGVPNTSNTKGD